jgi:hypothetical protein
MMGDVLVKAANLRGGRIEELHVQLHNLPARVIDRDTALAWMRDGHSLVPLIGGRRGTALQLVEVGEADEPFIRPNNERVAEDQLPELPPVR